MPPSPASRRSPSTEMGVENHKRGRSLEGGLLVQKKDDDLALFNELLARERDNLLLQSSDDFEDAFSSKMRHFADDRIGISISSQGESSDLLNADGEKNDYEWLMTPPESPLFRSLDDEPEPANIPSRGRTRSQPIAISRSSTVSRTSNFQMEQSHRSSRGSASPSRSSPSPRSFNSVGQSRGKPSSAPHTSPVSSIRSSTPSRRASPPPSKSSTPGPRSCSPTPRRMSTGSSASAGTTRVRGESPQKVSRGKSASPKIKAWQTNIPGFSCDVPANLRTSLADQPASYVRGSSPASRCGLDSSARVNRQSMSPTATRSASSSYSHEQDWLSSFGRGSMASSGDDDSDSLQSVATGSVEQSIPRKIGMYSNNNRSLAYSRRLQKISSSAPKRSFDSVVWQMDNRKAPQNMFRPLLSSVPSTTFCVGKASSTHSITSLNSSVTTSSNTSSDRGMSALPEPDGNYYSQDDIVGELGKMICPDIQEEVFAFDRTDEEEFGSELYGDIDRCHLTGGGPVDSDDTEVGSTREPAQVPDGVSEVDNLGSTMLCSRCGCSYDATDLMEMEIKLCKECRMKGNFPDAIIPEALTVAADKPPVVSISRPGECEDLDSLSVVSGSHQVAEINESKDSRTHLLDDSASLSRMEVEEVSFANGGGEQPTGRCGPPVRGTSNQEPDHFSNHLNTKITEAEGAGISLLLKRSSSTQGLVVQGRAFTVSTVLPYDDISYVRETSTGTRSSILDGSFSSSSSIDLSSSRQTESQMQRQFSGRKSGNGNYRYEVKSQSIESSLSGTLIYSPQAIGLVTTTPEVNFEGSVGDSNNNFSVETAVAPGEQQPGSEVVGTQLAYSSSTRSEVLEEDNSEHAESGRQADALPLQLSSLKTEAGPEDDLLACFDNKKDGPKLENCEDSQENVSNETGVKASSALQNAMSGTSVSILNEMSAATDGSPVSTSEIEVHDCHESVSGSEVIGISPDPNIPMDKFQESPEPISSDPVVDILGESTVTVESHGRNRTRSLTLEEATDTILFCSSIVHDLAYRAATIAMENDKEPSEILDGFWPTVTIGGKSSSDGADPRSGRIISKRGLKPHRAAPQKKQINTDKKPLSSKLENDENMDGSVTRNIGLPHKPDSTNPPKLESKCNCTIM